MTGKKNHRVAIERLADGLTPTGQVNRVWDRIAVRWAEIVAADTLSLETETSAGQMNSATRFRIRCDGYVEVRGEDRVVHLHDGRVFAVAQVAGSEGRASASAPEVEILAVLADQLAEDK